MLWQARKKHIAVFPFKKRCSSTTYNSHSFSDCYRAYIFNSLKPQQTRMKAFLAGEIGTEARLGGGGGNREALYSQFRKVPPPPEKQQAFSPGEWC